MVNTKYIFVTGGVSSSLGKGIFCASLGRLLQAHGLRVSIQKLDPYINVDPGTMNPYEHGEVFVTDDGAETDLDLGHYERFLGHKTSQANNVTTGRVYSEVIGKERAGEYLGKTVQVVPHIIDEIKAWIVRLADRENLDVIISEIGGTVGDIESLPYLEAIRQLRYEMGPVNAQIAHLTLVPYLAAAGELKTKPTQHSVKMLLSHGLQPDLLVCRSEHPLDQELREKIARFCNVETRAVIEAADAPSIYEVPLQLARQGVQKLVLERLGMASQSQPGTDEPDLKDWTQFVERLYASKTKVSIALVGKYVAHQDAYKSITESLILAAAKLSMHVDVIFVESEDLTDKNCKTVLEKADGILVAPGFGSRGIEGKIATARYARTHEVPFLGICLGLQCAIIAFARDCCNLDGAHSTEFDPDSSWPIIDLMKDQKMVSDKGGTMRLGAYNCEITEHSQAHTIYNQTLVRERHRHRYEVNNAIKHHLEAKGLRFTGINPESGLVEIVELPSHPWYIGVQFHPEYRSTVGHPHPLFTSFITAAEAASL
ncbi:MAG: CTP synthase [Bacteroidetes bacterium]|nr:CTP synthase [Bacteroidota bacterium]MCY4205094.1 CTP synthase [Bacteroidota bacterium]MCY4279087.1 CTP synthase [Acidimicrobiaceae bacterium]